MIKYLKDELKHIPMILVLIVLCYGIITLADNYLFNSSDVKYNNTTSGVQSGDVQGAIDELYACASNYAAYNTRLTSVESDKSDKSSTVSTISWDTTNKKLTKTINGSTTDVVTGATILGGLTKSQVTTALGYTPPTTNTTYSAGTGLSLSGTTFSASLTNNLTSTSTTSALTAAQGKALNDKITWSSKSTTGSSTITMPNTWTEANIFVKINSYYGYTFHLLRSYINSGEIYLRNGMNQNEYCSVYMSSDGNIKLSDAYSGGNNYTSTTKVYVYYR